MIKTSIVILAAGKSKRMKSSKSKVLHTIANRPLIDFVNEAATKNSTSEVCYVCSKEVEKYIKKNFLNAKTIIQEPRLGTAHAVECAKKIISKNTKNIIVLFGDVPFVKSSTIKKLIKYKEKTKSIGTIITFLTKNPFGYGRVIAKKNFVEKIVEERDTNINQKKIKICNSGILICNSKYIFKTLKKITNKNNQKERFLTDICQIAFNEKKPFTFLNCEESEVSGINSTKQLIELDLKFQNTFKNILIKKGVNLIQPETIRVSYDTKLSNDVIVEPHTVFNKGVKVNKFTKILSGSYLEDCNIGKNCSIGPNARIRPGTEIKDNAKIGNFVEVKKSIIGNFSSIAHLCYIGDTKIGNKTNIGAGTITCNYDGYKKNKTTIGDGVFIGSNCSLIAPLKIDNNSVVGAGSVVTKNVPISSLAVSRAKLLIKKRKKNQEIRG